MLQLFMQHVCQYLLCMFQQFGPADFWHGASVFLGQEVEKSCESYELQKGIL